VRSVDERGIVVRSAGDRAVDVLFDGRRVWSFWVRRDTEPDGFRRRLAPWPVPLRRFLDGHARVVVREPGSSVSYFDEEVSFGDGGERIRVVNKRGVHVGFDKSGKLVPTFETRGRGDIAALVAATRSVLDALATAGVQPFLGYGTLLGAVREGAVLGHDSDADICYVSDHEDPVDVRASPSASSGNWSGWGSRRAGTAGPPSGSRWPKATVSSGAWTCSVASSAADGCT
jgi:hypothetical protein